MSGRRCLTIVLLIGALFAFAPRAFAAGPLFTSVASTTFTVGTAGSYTVTTSGASAAKPVTITVTTGTLPSGVTLTQTATQKTDPLNTATLSGTPANSTAGTHSVTFTANNADGTATQPFTLTVAAAAPAITSASSTAFTVGSAGSFTVTTTGGGTMTITETGTLPTGVTLTQTVAQKAAGTAILAGTPVAADAGNVFPITITASNTVAPAATQVFALTVRAPTLAPSCLTLAETGAPSKTFRRGERFFVKGFIPNAANVNILLNGSNRIGFGRADDSGLYLVAAMIPSDARTGASTVVASGTPSNSTAVLGQATCGIDIIPIGAVAAATSTPRPGTTPTLPRTGLPIWVIAALALTLVEVGGGLLVFADGHRKSPLVAPRVHRFNARVRTLYLRHLRRRRLF